MNGAPMLEAQRVDRAARQGEALADNIAARVRDCSDPDAFMRVLLQLLADSGHLVRPSSTLRAFCARLQRVLGEGRS